jgi:hypothetical protein
MVHELVMRLSQRESETCERDQSAFLEHPVTSMRIGILRDFDAVDVLASKLAEFDI